MISPLEDGPPKSTEGIMKTKSKSQLMRTNDFWIGKVAERQMDELDCEDESESKDDEGGSDTTATLTIPDGSYIILCQSIVCLRTVLDRWSIRRSSKSIEAIEELAKTSTHIPMIDLKTIHVTRLTSILCLFHFELIYAIPAHELIDPQWAKTSSNYPNIKRYIHHINCLTMWVSSSILDCQAMKDRVTMMSKWIAVAEQARMWNNFTAVAAILARYGERERDEM
jgi:hypothetical protein